MDDYFLWIPIVFGIITVFLFLFSGAAFSHDQAGGGFFLAVLGVMFMLLFSLCLFENGNGHAITAIGDNFFLRMVFGQTYEVVYQSETGSEVLLRGIDGVRYYHFDKRVPEKFIVGKDYELVPLTSPPPLSQ